VPSSISVRSQVHWASGGEEFDDGLEVERSVLSIDGGALREAVGEEMFGLCFGDECH
jgi:hypothetical protein